MKKEGVALIIVFLTSVLVFLPDAFSQVAKPKVELSCYDAGEFYIGNLEDRGKVYARIGSSWVSVSGEWKDEGDLNAFRSEEAVFLNPQESVQRLRVGDRYYSVTCPGFVFSCKLINISINACYKRNETFYGRFTAYSFRYDKKNEFRFEQPFLLTYKVKTDEGKELTHAPQILSPEFEQVAMTRARRVGSNRFSLMWNTTREIDKLMIQYQSCDNRKYNFYDSFYCTDLPACSTDKGCRENEVCDDNLCVPISCAACQYVEDHQCRDFECCGDDDCNQDYYCENRQCLPLICDYNEAPVDHACTELECGDDEYAYNNTCLNLNCGENRIAVNHVCVDCEQDETAVGNNCEKLSCGFLKSPRNHECVSLFKILFGRK